MINYMTGIMNHLEVTENELFDLLDLEKNLMHQNFRLNQYGLIDDYNINNAEVLRKLITGQYIIKKYLKGENIEIINTLLSKLSSNITDKRIFKTGNTISLFCNKCKYLIKEIKPDSIIVEIL